MPNQKRRRVDLSESLLAAVSRRAVSATAVADLATAAGLRVDEARVKRQTQERLKAANGETQCLNGQGVERTVLVANLDRLLHFVLARCDAWRERRPGEPLKLLLFCDECQGGNVLNPVPWKKICFFHISLCEAPPLWRKSPHGWLPVAAVPYLLLQDIEGGHSRVTREVVAALSRFRENAIPLGNGQWATFKSSRSTDS